jgi:hypothetical protein
MNSPRKALSEVKDRLRSTTANVEQIAASQIDEYRGGHEIPLRSYAVFMTAYGAAVATGVVVGRRRGVRLPERLGAGDLVLLAVATHRLSRLVSKDSITAVLRAPFTRYVEPIGAGEVNEEVRGQGLRHAIGELIGCPFCLAQWIGTAFVGGLIIAPGPTRAVATVFTIVTVSDVLQFAYAALEASDD